MTTVGKRGIVAYFNAAKGFGFIRPVGTNESLYVHCTSILGAVKSLAKDQRVRFDVVTTARGPAAVNVVEEA